MSELTWYLALLFWVLLHYTKGQMLQGCKHNAIPPVTTPFLYPNVPLNEVAILKRMITGITRINLKRRLCCVDESATFSVFWQPFSFNVSPTDSAIVVKPFVQTSSPSTGTRETHAQKAKMSDRILPKLRSSERHNNRENDSSLLAAH